MTREKQIQRLNSYLEDDLKPREIVSLERELEGDASLRAELDALRETRRLLHSLPEPEVPSDFSVRVMARVRSDGAEIGGIRRRLGSLFSISTKPVVVPLAALACGLVAAVLVFGADVGDIVLGGDRGDSFRFDSRQKRDSEAHEAVVTSAGNVEKPSFTTDPERRSNGVAARIRPDRRLFSTAPRTPVGPRVVAESLDLGTSVGQADVPFLATCLPGTVQSDPSCNQSYMRWLSLAREDAPTFWRVLSRLPNPQRKIWHGRLVDFAARSGSGPLVFRAPSQPDVPGVRGSLVVAE